jgi:hypothetical protein
LHEQADLLRDDELLRELLRRYRELKVHQPQAEWHDRVMDHEGLEAEQLCRLHGLLLANGWIETRVYADAFATPGRLAQCYRATPEGARALIRADNPFADAEQEAPAAGWS